MSSANSEQLLAIRHEGGVLLSAGAGSGKTFVLIQHMLYLGENELARTQALDYETRQIEIKKYFSSVVLMTFTKKATGELKIRLRKIIQDIDKDPIEKRLLAEGFSMINVSTIHGFCSTLISLGYIHGVSSTIRVISQTEYIEKMDTLFEQWLIEVMNDQQNLTDWQKDVLFSNIKEINKSLSQVFATPELRVKWENTNIDADIDYKKFLNDYLALLNISTPKEAIAKVYLPADQKLTKQKWYEYVIKIKEITDHNTLDSLASLQEYHDFFNGISRLMGPKESLGLSSVNDFFSWMKDFRDVLKSGLMESLLSYEAHKQDAYREWQDLFYKAFLFISKNYELIPGLTFSDLEFYVFKGLREVETQKLVSNQFKYFVVDEFQDTSAIQYEIIKSCINGDLNKLFCVGDVKQAIYGFRGGELGVFADCSNQIPKKLSLLNNYRSRPSIVHFNNLFFESLFYKGLGFEGEDNHSVNVERQFLPEGPDTSEIGKVLKYNITLNTSEEKWKPSSDEISKFEALGLMEMIQSLRAESKGLICVLYKNLKPSKELIALLTKQNISFRAQVKLSVSEEPVVCLFGFCLAYKEAPDFRLVGIKHFEKYLELLECSSENGADILTHFLQEDQLFGLIPAFEKLMFRTGLANSAWSHNIETLTSLVENIGADSSKIAASYEVLENEQISLDFYFGDSAPEVLIMTAHSSKGLQFPHVLIGGIHNNGRHISNNDFFGKIPGSFKWKTEQNQKTPFKSPYYLYENALDKRKDFSESKRLFYVAATRAENTLGFIDLRLQDGTPLQTDKNSWICGLRIAAEETDDQFGIESSCKEFDADNILSTESAIETPAFHRDTLGVTSLIDESDHLHSIELATVPDMSVTGLSTLALCPRKFYLSQVCKIEAEFYKAVPGDEDKEQNGQQMVSSAERGTYLHAVLADACVHNFVINLSTLADISKPDQESVNFALQYIKETYGYNMQYSAERVLKFSVFGHMISGTADLVIEGDKYVVIDFKTGKRPIVSDHYWAQLLLYSFALGQIHECSDQHEIELSLLYIDEKTVDSRRLMMGDVRTQVFNLWKKTTRLDEVNLTHCDSCSFGNLCLLKEGSVASS
jgi:ATP-dependent helicase/nuclease subunit A